jgi:hypothetical protein
MPKWAKQYAGDTPAAKESAGTLARIGQHARMARAHGIAIILAIVGGTGFWLYDALTPEPIAPPFTALPSQAKEQDPRVDKAQAIRTNLPTAEPAAVELETPPSPLPPTTPQVTTSVPITAKLMVTDTGTRSAVLAFLWRFRSNVAGAADVRGEGKAGVAELSLAPLAEGILLIEAKGYAPERTNLALPAFSTFPTQILVALTRNQELVGAIITARDDQGVAIARLRLDLWQLAPGANDPERNADPIDKPLWSRLGTGTDGVFQLPELPSGRLALRAQPVDDRGDAQPLLPWRQVFSFGGNESVPFAVDFSQGMVLVLTADPNGGPGLDLACTLRRSGVIVPSLWRSRSTEQAVGSLGQDLITLPGRATTALSVPLGDYAIEISQGALQLPVTFTGGDGRLQKFYVHLPR